MSPLRKKIAAQLVMAQQNAAMLTTFNEVDMSAVIQLRSRYQENFQKRHGIKLGFMSFFVKAAVDALQSAPAINARAVTNDTVTLATETCAPTNGVIDSGETVTVNFGLRNILSAARANEAKQKTAQK